MASKEDLELALKAELHLFAKGDLRRELTRLRRELTQELAKEGSLSLSHTDPTFGLERAERGGTAGIFSVPVAAVKRDSSSLAENGLTTSIGVGDAMTPPSYSHVVSFESETDSRRGRSGKLRHNPTQEMSVGVDPRSLGKGFSGSLAAESISADMFNLHRLDGADEERSHKPSPPAVPLPCQVPTPSAATAPPAALARISYQESAHYTTHAPPMYPSAGIEPADEPESPLPLRQQNDHNRVHTHEWSSHHMKTFRRGKEDRLCEEQFMEGMETTPALFGSTSKTPRSTRQISEESCKLPTQGSERLSGQATRSSERLSRQASAGKVAFMESEASAPVMEHRMSERSSNMDPTSPMMTQMKTNRTSTTIQSSYTEEQSDAVGDLPDLGGHAFSGRAPMSSRVKTHANLERTEQQYHKAWANTSLMKSMRQSAENLTAGKFKSSLMNFGGIGKGRQKSMVLFTQHHAAELAKSKQSFTTIALRFLLENILLYLDAFSVVIISLNACTIGIQTDYMARHGEASGFDWRWVETVFCLLFLIELLLRMSIFRSYYFRMPSWRWNVFDCIVVGLQVLEELVLLAGPSGIFVSVSMLRTVRILRLMRLIRVIRLLRFFSELRTIVCAVTASLKPLCSTILLFFILIYLVGVFLTQLVVQAKASQEYSPEQTQGLNAFFGSVPTTILMLWQSISGGLDWGDAVVPLARISPIMAILFSLYIAFSVLAMMNIVTGVFVESAISKGREDQDSFLINAVRDLFRKVYQDENGQISWEDFQRHLEEKVMQDYFAAIDVDTSEARGLFTLLDWNDDGLIEAEEFLSGCVRLKGSAKALDLQLLMRESRRSAQKIFSRVNDAIAMLRRLSDCMDLPPLPDLPMGKQPTGHTTVVNGV